MSQDLELYLYVMTANDNYKGEKLELEIEWDV